MNQRQKKKRKLKFWRLAGEPYTQHWKQGVPVFYYHETVCPYCGYDCYGDNDWKLAEGSDGSLQLVDIRSYFDGEYSVTDWTIEAKCPICKKIYYVDDSDC